jgi:hypothetical protein
VRDPDQSVNAIPAQNCDLRNGWDAHDEEVALRQSDTPPQAWFYSMPGTEKEPKTNDLGKK